MSRFTFDAAAERFSVWSPDGSRVVFYSTRNGPGDLFVKFANGSGPEQQIPAPEQFKLPTSWSADGRYLLFQRTDPQTSSDLWVLSMATDHPTASVFLKTSAAERFGAFSPDGRWVAYQSNESGRNEIYVRPFLPPGGNAAPAAVWQISTGGGIMPVWAHDGKELFFLNPVGGMMSASITVSGSTFVPGAPVQLFATRLVGGGTDNQQGRQYDVAPDGRFLINRMLDQATPPITLIQNWHPPAR
jgi:Tol biopolymer transport system component